MVVASSYQSVQADGCGGRHGRISVGNGGISIGHFHIQPSVPQYQRHYAAPYQQSYPSGYDSSSQVIYQDPNSYPVVHPQPGQPQPFPANAVPAGQANPGFPGQPGPNQANASVPNMKQPVSAPVNPGQNPNVQNNGMPMANNGMPMPNNGMNATNNGMNNGMNMQAQMQPNQAQGMFPGQASMPSQPNGMPVSNQAVPETANGANMSLQGNVPSENSGLSALQILSSFGGGNGADPTMPGIPTATQIPPSHFGTWVVNMNGNQMVKLVLQPNNTFVWVVIKDGKESRLEGQYRLDGERLILVRSSDLQQMAGTWTGSGSNFTFKLDGVPDSGMPFARAQ